MVMAVHRIARGLCCGLWQDRSSAMRPGSTLAALAALAALGCAPAPERERDRIPAAQSAVELAGRGTIFTLATALTGQRSRIARLREEASRATGAIVPDLVDASGAPLRAANGTRMRGTCGVTFVAPSYAVTAAHCVDGTIMDMTTLAVEMYRPTPALDQGFLAATALTGTFPDFQHARLGPGDGYLVERVHCELVSRCSDAYGGAVSCEAAMATGADAALVRCDGAPGARFGFLDVATTDEPAGEVFMPWKHEVYDVPVDSSMQDDRFQHYVVYAGPTTGNNYHYFAADAAGVDVNQLLPLVSADFADGTPHHKLGAGAPGGTDLFGCHGTSGSGVLQPGARGFLELLGPVLFGNDELDTFLCDHDPSLLGSSRGPGATGISYGPLALTRYLLARNQAAVDADCDPFAAGRTTLYTHLDCLRRGLLALPGAAAFAARLAAPTAPSGLDDLQGPVATLAAGDSVGLSGFTLAAGERYRVGLEARADAACAAPPCPRLAVGIGAQAEVLAQSLDGAAPTPLAATYQADATGTAALTLTVDAAGASAVEVGALTLRPEAEVEAFDSFAERLQAVLFDLGGDPAAPQPARFVGDGKQGFALWLLPSERAVLTRQALAPGHLWSARFSSSGAAALSCGLLDAAGQVAARADCTSGFVQLDDRASTAAARAGFFIESAAGGQPAAIDDLVLVSDAMPDGDGDSIPDVLDPCPRGPLPAGGEPLEIDLPATSAQDVCVPEPATVAVPVPRVANACEPSVLAGRLTAVNGKPLGDLVVGVPAAGGQVLLPLGTSTITWEVRDARGRVYATAAHTITLAHVPAPGCCAGPCALADAGDDLLRGGPEGDYLWGGAGSDYLSGGGGDDVLMGGDGDDYLGAGPGGAVALYGGAGDDTIHARLATSARIFTGPGADVVVGSDGDDQIFPGAGTILVAAGAGDDTVTIYDACQLGAGMRLLGGAGSDTLVSPVPEEALSAAGVQVDGFENVIVDTTHAYLAECF
jgi:hypothetical protein